MKSLPVLGMILFIILAIVLIGFGPIFTIWSLNLLFGMTTPVTIWTWLSTAWLQSIVVGSAAVRFNQNKG